MNNSLLFKQATLIDTAQLLVALAENNDYKEARTRENTDRAINHDNQTTRERPLKHTSAHLLVARQSDCTQNSYRSHEASAPKEDV